MKRKYLIHCNKCNLLVESDKREGSDCPSKPKNRKIKWSPTSNGPSFTERLYSGGFYHAGIGEVVNSEAHLKKRCEELGLRSKHEGASLSAKDERKLMAQRLVSRPKSLLPQKVKSNPAARYMPTLETYDRE